MKTDTLGYTIIARFKVRNEIFEIDRYGDDDYSVYLVNEDYSERGTYLDIANVLRKYGVVLSEVAPPTKGDITAYRLFYEERGYQKPQVKEVEGKDLEDALNRFAKSYLKYSPEEHPCCKSMGALLLFLFMLRLAAF